MNDRLRINRLQFVSSEETALPTASVGWRNAAVYGVLIDMLVLAVTLLLYALVAGWLSPFLPDDSFISFRYAEYLVQGHGLTFNVGEAPVEGYSNFLWVLLMAVGGWLGQDLAGWSVNLGLGIGGITVTLLWWILRRRGVSGLRLGLLVGLLSLSGPLTLYAISGMETALFACLLLAAVLASDFLLQRRSWLPALLLGFLGFLVALTRPEGHIALPVLLVNLFIFGRRPLVGDRERPLLGYLLLAGGLFVLLLAIYHSWRIAYFDALLPTPFLSKGGGGSSLINAWFTNARFFFVRQTHYYSPMAYYYGALMMLGLVGAAVSYKKRFERRVEFTALVLALVYCFVYVNFVDWMPGMRYYAPLTALLLIPLSMLACELALPQAGIERWRVELPFGLLYLLLAGLSLFSVAMIKQDSESLQAGATTTQVELGHWLHDHIPAGARLAISDVGAAPYYSQLPTLDINPEALTDRYIAENGWSADYFFQVAPDVVVLTAFSLTEPDFYPQHEDLNAEPRFQDTYRLVGVTRTDWHWDRSYWVFVSEEIVLSDQQLATFPPGLKKQ